MARTSRETRKTSKRSVPVKKSSGIEKKLKRNGRDVKSKVDEKSKSTFIDDDRRRSSDRRKIPVERYGLDFRFIPEAQSPRLSSSNVASTRSDETFLNASSSKSLSGGKGEQSITSTRNEGRKARDEGKNARNDGKNPRNEGKNPRNEGKNVRNDGKNARNEGKNAKKARISKANKAIQSTKKESKPSSSTSKKSRISEKEPTSARSSTRSKGKRSKSNTTKKAKKETVDEELEIENASVSKKRKREPSASSKNEKRIKQTIDEVTASVTTSADSESDEGKEKSTPSEKKKAKRADRKLKARPQAKQYLHEPTFESKDEMPFVSVTAYSKLAIRAVLINNENLLKRLIDDVEHVERLDYCRSIDVPLDAAAYAMINGNGKLLQMLIDDEKKPRTGRVQPLRSLILQESTGQADVHMLGHAVRPIQMSRGGKEGVNAFTKDLRNVANLSWLDRLRASLIRNVPFRIIQQLQLQNVLAVSQIAEHVYEAVRFGHNKLAASMASEYGGNYFNQLHIRVLSNDDQPLATFKAISVKKKGLFNKDITPLHCACINPNEKYLAALLAVDPDYNHADQTGYRCVHYASVCSSVGPLRLLLRKGAQPSELTKEGENALHLACAAGRAHNVELIVGHSKTNDPDLAIVKHRSRLGYTPLHLAARHGHLDAIKALRRSAGIALDIDEQASAKSKCVTATMLAAQQGHLPIVEYLIKEANASATKGDKLKRTSLMHAVMNGMSHVASFLVRYGVDLDAKDTSGNTATHYAASYGWYFCMKLLMDARANVDATNDWQLTPLACAYMKGHMGLADLLLQQPGTDINRRDSQGNTLITATLSSRVDESSLDQLNYLIKRKNADVTLCNVDANTPLHFLAACNLKAKIGKDENAIDANARLSITIAELLIERGVNMDATNNAGDTAMTVAVETGKLPLARYLVHRGAKLRVDDARMNESNLFHALMNLIDHSTEDGRTGNDVSNSVLDIVHTLMKNQSKETLTFMQSVDKRGMTPFLLAVSKYDERIGIVLNSVISALLTIDPNVILQRINIPKENEVTKESEDENSDNSENENENQPTPNESDLNGCTALHLLARRDVDSSRNTIASLLAQHMKTHEEIDYSNERFLDAVDGTGETALFTAVKNRRIELALQLVQMGCNVNVVRRLPASLRQNTLATHQDHTSKASSKPSLPDLVTILMEAVRVQSTVLAQALLKTGADVHAEDSDGNTALHYACMKSPSEVNIVKRLLEAGANYEARNHKQRTPLHLACNADTGLTDVSTDTVACLLNYGADPFVKDIRGRLPLHYAFIKMGKHNESNEMDPVAICTIVLPRMTGQPQCLNTADVWGCTPLHLAARRGSNICCMSLLGHNQVERNAKDNDANTPLAMAVLYRHMAATLTLIQAEADVNVTVHEHREAETGDQDSMQWAPTKASKTQPRTMTLSAAVVDREWQGVVYLLMDIFNKRKQSLYPLLEAAVEGRKYNLSLTLLRMSKTHVNLLASNNEKRGLFHLLADCERPSNATSIQLQLQVADAIHDAGISLDEQYETGVLDPIFYAAIRRNVPLLRYFLHKCGKSKWSNESDTNRGRNVLTYFVWNIDTNGFDDEELGMLGELITKYAFNVDVIASYPVPVDLTSTDPNSGSYWIVNSERYMKVTPLIHAVHARSFMAVKNLLKLGANVNLADADGVTPLMHSVRLNEPSTVKLLLNADYVKPDKEYKARVKFYVKPGDEQEASEENSDESESENGGNVKRSSTRVFHVDGDVALPISQFSVDDPSSRERTQSWRINETTKTQFRKTSNLDLNAVDRSGRNVLHYLVSPLEIGAWTNVVDLWTLLVDLGADSKRADVNGLTPLDYVRKYRHRKLAQLLGVTLDKDTSTHWTVVDDARDVTNEMKGRMNVSEDANEYLSKLRAEKASERERNKAKFEDEKKRRRLRPHRLSGYSNMGEIVVDESDERDGDEKPEAQAYDVLMNKVDFNVGLYGYYNFYRMQLIKWKGREFYVLFTNWGRIGSEGQYQKTPYGKLTDAVKEFRSIFRAKTGNEWAPDMMKKFVERPNKYRLINREDDEKLQESSLALDVPIILDTQLKSTLPDHLQTFMRNVTNINDLVASAKRIFERSRLDLTLTALKKETILRADMILNELGRKINEYERIRTRVHEHEKLVAGLNVYDEICKLSTEFYFLLPLRSFERISLSVIDDVRVWVEYKHGIELLLKYEIANHLLCAAANRRTRIHPYDYIYTAVDTCMQRLNGNEQETQCILHYVHCTSSDGYQVKEIYKLYNDAREKRFTDTVQKVENRWLLWHGTSAANVLGILQAGLLIAPPQALHTGHLFGKGIYLSDAFSKSAGYCASSDRMKFAFLCEAALGNVARMKGDHNLDTSYDPLPDGYDSVEGVGRTCPNGLYDFTFRNGTQIPFGQLTEQTFETYNWLEYNEYIVYDPNQVTLRYLVMFK